CDKSDYFPEHVFKLKKALYGLKRASCAWNFFLLENSLTKDIIFGAIDESLCKEFSKNIKKMFEMSTMVELKFFLTNDTIYIHQTNWKVAKIMSTSMYRTLVLGLYNVDKSVVMLSGTINH
ncbi:hypothetical protein CR513_01522, partial [Mucuna pruriens]